MTTYRYTRSLSILWAFHRGTCRFGAACRFLLASSRASASFAIPISLVFSTLRDILLPSHPKKTGAIVRTLSRQLQGDLL